MFNSFVKLYVNMFCCVYTMDLFDLYTSTTGISPNMAVVVFICLLGMMIGIHIASSSLGSNLVCCLLPDMVCCGH